MKELKPINWTWGILPVAIFLAIWEMVARLNLVPGQFFFPPFSVAMQEFYYLTASGILGENFLSMAVTRSLVKVAIPHSLGGYVAT